MEKLINELKSRAERAEKNAKDYDVAADSYQSAAVERREYAKRERAEAAMFRKAIKKLGG